MKDNFNVKIILYVLQMKTSKTISRYFWWILSQVYQEDNIIVKKKIRRRMMNFKKFINIPI